MAAIQQVDREAIYRRFREGEWTACSFLEDEDLRSLLTRHKVVYSAARHAVVLNEPFACERL